MSIFAVHVTRKAAVVVIVILNFCLIKRPLLIELFVSNFFKSSISVKNFGKFSCATGMKNHRDYGKRVR